MDVLKKYRELIVKTIFFKISKFKFDSSLKDYCGRLFK